jgi:hypothetical protein
MFEDRWRGSQGRSWIHREAFPGALTAAESGNLLREQTWSRRIALAGFGNLIAEEAELGLDSRTVLQRKGAFFVPTALC